MAERTDTLVVEVLAGVLGLDPAAARLVRRPTEPAWDSLKHVEVVLTLESALGIRFDEAEFAELNDVPSIVEVAERHRAA